MRHISLFAVLVTLLINTSPVNGLVMYWTDTGSEESIRRANLDGSGQQIIVPGIAANGGIALDLINGHVYWAQASTGGAQSGVVRRANLDGSNIETLLTGLNSPQSIALDVINKQIYLSLSSDFVNIQRSNFDGTNLTDLVSGIGNPRDIELDLFNGHIYWSDVTSKTIRRSTLAGSNVTNVVTGDFPLFISLDVTNGNIYWVEGANDKIQRSSLDGSNITDIVTSNTGIGRLALDINNSQIYWTTAGISPSGIRRSNFDGTNIVTLTTFNMSTTFHLVLDLTSSTLPVTQNDTPAPEPITATLSLIGLGVLGMATRRRVT